ncbi:unnamed protein product [Caenorhabditis auriculariae]|uniref:UBR-type domain-containing protein n=1 Tax=Caenorhabditis auriculariae TaxID=2777116 RepID=A0A8S1GNH7_9PELO|nr:unnamed protein product [Caenorhabditis auriculariae]
MTKLLRRRQEKEKCSGKKENSSEAEEDDPVVTISEVLQGIKEVDEVAKGLFGAQNQAICTFPEGYKPRQAVFACLTCTPEPKKAGICYGCSLNCHEGHEIVDLYTKRKFRCDCGNEKFDSECKLYEEKDKNNEYNKYDHNYIGLFCTCNNTYPCDGIDEEMLQCVTCEDWFHPSHINCEAPKDKDIDCCSLVCTGCLEKYPFFEKLRDTTGTVCFSNREESVKTSEGDVRRALIVEAFLQSLCKCAACTTLYERFECEFLLDPEDDLASYEQENVKKANEIEENSREGDDVRLLVREVGMDKAIRYLEGVNDLKRKMTDWLSSMDGAVVHESDVKSFFGRLKEENEAKRARIE